jgi:hypothetical protein
MRIRTPAARRRAFAPCLCALKPSKTCHLTGTLKNQKQAFLSAKARNRLGLLKSINYGTSEKTLFEQKETKTTKGNRDLARATSLFIPAFFVFFISFCSMD